MMFAVATCAYTCFLELFHPVIIPALNDTNWAMKGHCSVALCPVCALFQCSEAPSVCTKYWRKISLVSFNVQWIRYKAKLFRKSHLGGVKRVPEVRTDSFSRRCLLHKGTIGKETQQSFAATNLFSTKIDEERKKKNWKTYELFIGTRAMRAQRRCWWSIFNEVQKFFSFCFYLSRPIAPKSHMRAHQWRNISFQEEMGKTEARATPLKVTTKKKRLGCDGLEFVLNT